MSPSKEVYEKWHRDVAQDENSSSTHLSQWHQTALQLLGDIRDKKLLEVGCGRGDFSIALATRGAHVTGIDFSESGIELAIEKSQKLSQKINFQVADAQNLPFADGSFDTVVSCECLEHVPRPELMVQEIFRVLKHGGQFVLTTENYSNGMLLLWMKTWLTGTPFNSGGLPQPIEHFFVFWKTKSLLRRSGFIIKNVTGTHYVFLMLPKTAPDTFVIHNFRLPWLRAFLKPLARHMAFLAIKK